MVQKVDVDSIWVVGCADWCDGGEGITSLSPRAAGHGARVIDDKDGVESGEEGILVLGAGDTGKAGRWRSAPTAGPDVEMRRLSRPSSAFIHRGVSGRRVVDCDFRYQYWAGLVIVAQRRGQLTVVREWIV